MARAKGVVQRVIRIWKREVVDQGASELAFERWDAEDAEDVYRGGRQAC